VEYGVRHCQEMSIILQRLINDGNLEPIERTLASNELGELCISVTCNNYKTIREYRPIHFYFGEFPRSIGQ